MKKNRKYEDSNFDSFLKEEEIIEEVVEKTTVRTSVQEIRAKRREAAELQLANTKEVLDQKEEFRKFFAKNKEKLKLKSSMEGILWLHFQAAGFAEKDKFEEGLKHFGI